MFLEKGGVFVQELDSYIINCETLLIVPCDKNKVHVYEIDNEFIVNTNSLKIIESSCLFFGCSLEGRKQGTKNLIDCEMKVPVVIEDSKNLIFFPTSSYKNKQSIWISYQNLLKYTKCDRNITLLNFKGNINVKVDVRYGIIDNQVIRCIKLDTFIIKRKNDLK